MKSAWVNNDGVYEFWDENGEVRIRLPEEGPPPEGETIYTPENFWQQGSWDRLPEMKMIFSQGADGAGNSLYQSIFAKVTGIGTPEIEDSWHNFKLAFTTLDPIGIASGLLSLQRKLAAAGSPPTEEDVNGDIQQGDSYDGWNTLCDRFNLPSVVEVEIQGEKVTLPFRLQVQ